MAYFLKRSTYVAYVMCSKKWLDDAISDGKISYEEISKREPIGEGSFGKVYLAECNSIPEKIVLKEKDIFYAFIKEVIINTEFQQVKYSIGINL
ncbi:5210_t:CDS:2 [Ambispora gerdemannii]|uniref:5210_t:CDS:1 n=1 Tax=Ambispora gerdemannii TaxID=144530 RepID=A0A9N9CFQ6_9GLOM|nr:5210_t:CDS:2 [Ambispora gerdemannii]